MVDRNARDLLAELVRHVAAGRISKDGFAGAAWELMEGSKDRALPAVFGAVAALHSDVSELWPVRFRGLFRLPPEERRKLAIAALFLYSGAEYEWQPVGSTRGACLDTLLAYACGILVFAGFMLLAVSFAASHWFAVAADLCLVGAVFLYRYSQRLLAKARAEWEEAHRRIGDYEVWPFIRRSDFDHARRHPRLFCGRSISS